MLVLTHVIRQKKKKKRENELVCGLLLLLFLVLSQKFSTLDLSSNLEQKHSLKFWHFPWNRNLVFHKVKQQMLYIFKKEYKGECLVNALGI